MDYYYKNVDGKQVQAMKLDPELVTVISVWCHGLVVEEIDPFDDNKRQPGLNVQTPEGVKRASLGDYIVRHDDKTFDVLKPNEFNHSHIWEP